MRKIILIALLLLILPVLASARSLTCEYDNPVALWHFDELSVVYTQDSCKYSGNNLNMTVTNAIPTINGKYSNAYRYDGATTWLETIGSTLQPNPTYADDFSVSMWFNQTNETGSYDMIFAKGDSDSNFLISINNGVDEIYIFKNGGSTFFDTNIAVTKNIWHNLVVVRSANLSLYVYFDGDLKAWTGNFNITPETNKFYIGRVYTTQHYFNGVIDEVAIFNRTLSGNEITNMYNGSIVENPTDLSVDYSITQVNGTTQLIKANYTIENGSVISGATVRLEYASSNYSMTWNASTSTYDIFYTPATSGSKNFKCYAEKSSYESKESIFTVNVIMPDAYSNLTMFYNPSAYILEEQMIKANYTFAINNSIIYNATVRLWHLGVPFAMNFNSSTNTYDIGFTGTTSGLKELTTTAEKSSIESQSEDFNISVVYGSNQEGINISLFVHNTTPPYWVDFNDYFCDGTYSVHNFTKCFKNTTNVLINCNTNMTYSNCTNGCYAVGVCSPDMGTIGMQFAGIFGGFIIFMGVAMRLVL